MAEQNANDMICHHIRINTNTLTNMITEPLVEQIPPSDIQEQESDDMIVIVTKANTKKVMVIGHSPVIEGPKIGKDEQFVCLSTGFLNEFYVEAGTFSTC